MIRTRTLLATTMLTGIMMAFSSCSGDDTPEPQPNVPDTRLRSIGFGGEGRQQQEETTRAGGIGLETLVQDFKVWGIKTMGKDGTENKFTLPQTVMDAYKVAWTENSADNTVSNKADWEYVGLENDNLPDKIQTIKYWDFSATSYRFYAIAPFDLEHGMTPSEGEVVKGDATYQSLNYYIEYDSDKSTGPLYYSDLWLSDNKGTEFISGTPSPLYTECVNLLFQTPLVRVRFRFIFPDGTEPKYVSINNCDFHDMENEGKTPVRAHMTILYPKDGVDKVSTTEWEIEEENGTGSLNMKIPYEETPMHGATEGTLRKWYYVLPMHNLGHTQGNYILEATVNGKHKSATVPAEYMQWKHGYEYTYVFKITDTGIAFDHALEVYIHWQAGVSGDTEWGRPASQD